MRSRHASEMKLPCLDNNQAIIVTIVSGLAILQRYARMSVIMAASG